jgi:hypothetical protein
MAKERRYRTVVTSAARYASRWIDEPPCFTLPCDARYARRVVSQVQDVIKAPGARFMIIGGGHRGCFNACLGLTVPASTLSFVNHEMLCRQFSISVRLRSPASLRHP